MELNGLLATAAATSGVAPNSCRAIDGDGPPAGTGAALTPNGRGRGGPEAERNGVGPRGVPHGAATGGGLVAGRITSGRMGGRLDDGGAEGCGEPLCTRNGVNDEGWNVDPAHVVAPAPASAAPPTAAVPIPIRAAGCTRGLGGTMDRSGVDGVCNDRMGPCRRGLPPPLSVPLPPTDPSPPQLSQRPGEESALGCRGGNGPSVCGGRSGGVDGVVVVGTTRKV